MIRSFNLVRWLTVVTLAVTTAVSIIVPTRPTGMGPQPDAGNILISAASAQPAPIKWGGPKNISMIPLIAEHKNIFAQEGVSATYVDIQTGKKAMDALRTGDIDLGVLVDVNIAFAGFEHADDLRVLACIQTKHDDALVVARDGFVKPGDLVGQTIGVTLGTTSHAYLVHLLEATGIRPSAVDLQNMPPAAIQAALLNGSLKAGSMWQPFRNNVLTAKPNAFTEVKEPNSYTSYVLLVSTKKFLEAHGHRLGNTKAIGKFLKALIAAESYIAQNQRPSQSILADELRISADVMKTIWQEYDLRVFLSEEILALLQQEGKWISESVAEHLGKPVPDYRPFIHEKILQSLAHHRVRGL